jgi:hypothetical protein
MGLVMGCRKNRVKANKHNYSNNLGMYLKGKKKHQHFSVCIEACFSK